MVLTKLDGSAKGGIVLAIQSELGIPVKLVGLGETADDLVDFDPDEFVDALLDHRGARMILAALVIIVPPQGRLPRASGSSASVDWRSSAVGAAIGAARHARARGRAATSASSRRSRRGGPAPSPRSRTASGSTSARAPHAGT